MSNSDKKSLNSSEDEEDLEFLMESHLEIGTQFLEVEPEQELTFYHEKGDLYTRFNLKNITEKANVAFYVYTSSKEKIYILPSQGFIQPGFEQTIQVAWAAADNPDDEKLERMLFFVKALPLSSKMEIEAMNQNLPRVFNTYNLNILFTVASLPTKVTMVPMPNMGAVPNQQVKTIKHRDDIVGNSDDDDEEDEEGNDIRTKQ